MTGVRVVLNKGVNSIVRQIPLFAFEFIGLFSFNQDSQPA